MLNSLHLGTQIFPDLSNIHHPLEGIAFLVVLALFFRWQWPEAWNQFLNTISVDQDSNSDKT